MTPESEMAVAKLIGNRLIARRDVMAIQGPEGAYRPSVCNCVWPTECTKHKATPFTLEALIEHVRGDKTYGHYLGDPSDQRTRICAFDLDVVKEPTIINGKQCESPRDAIQDTHHPQHYEIMKQLKFLADGLAVRLNRMAKAAGFPMTVAMAFSGAKGVHVYGIFDQRTLVKNARYIPQLTLQTFECFEKKKGDNVWRHKFAYEAVEIEVFPKQDRVNDTGYGNLMRLPMGKHRKTGARGFFMKVTPPNSNDFRFEPMDPIEALTVGSL